MIVAASICNLKATMFRRSVFVVVHVSGSFRDPVAEGQGVNRPWPRVDDGVTKYSKEARVPQNAFWASFLGCWTCVHFQTLCVCKCARTHAYMHVSGHACAQVHAGH